DTTPHRRVEDASAGNLEIREAGSVEDLREPQEIDRRHVARKRLLPEQPDRRVDELGHAGSLAPHGLSVAAIAGTSERGATLAWASVLVARAGDAATTRLRARDVAAFARVDLDALAHVHEQRH